MILEVWMKYLLYFIIGGGITVGTTMVADRGSGTLAAIVATLPLFTVVTALCIYYSTAGVGVTTDFFGGMIKFTPAWLMSVAAFWWVSQMGLNIWYGAAVCLVVYTIAALITLQF